MHRWGTPEDVARVARFLVGPAAGFLTGQIIRVNGGAVRCVSPRRRTQFATIPMASAGRSNDHADRPRYLFVTGRLAEFALRQVLDDWHPKAGFAAEVAVLPITVAALMTPRWIARHLEVPAGHRSGLPARPLRRRPRPGPREGGGNPGGDGARSTSADLPRYFGQRRAVASRIWRLPDRDPGRDQSRPALADRGIDPPGPAVSRRGRRRDRPGLRPGRRGGTASAEAVAALKAGGFPGLDR